MGRITFLGTGDPLNPERVQTSLALPLNDGTTLLLDVAGGTSILGQLAAAGIALEAVRHLFVSHRHFDHVGGLAPLLVALVPLTGAALTIHATPETTQALHDLLATTIPGVEGWVGSRLHWQPLSPGQEVAVADARVRPFLVEHGIECVGFHLTQGDRRVVFTADTRPCPAVVAQASGADLLIHEVYSLDSGAASAHLFGHSTAADTGRIASAAGVQRLVLTHLRSRHCVDPSTLATEAAAFAGCPITLASDLATVEF